METSQHRFSALRRLKKYLEGPMNMKQDLRLNNGLLMHVNNLIMNDPDTVEVTSKQTNSFLFHTNYAKDILGNLSRGIRLA